MKNLIITGNVFPMGPHIAYGGERIVYYLIKELAKRNNVYVFAREGSNFEGIPIRDYTPVGPLQSDVDVHFSAVEDYIYRTGLDADLYMCNYFSDGWDPRIRTTFPNYAELTWCRWAHCPPFFKEGTPTNIVSYSNLLQWDFQASKVPTTMIYYGIPEDLYSLEREHDGYAVWIGKIEGGKAPHLAIELALAANMKIVLMGPPYNTGCFFQTVQPYIEKYPDKVFWVRGVDDEQKRRIMSRAKVFISSNDNSWREHFGIVNTEALAMGVPIIAFSRIGQECAIVTDQIIEDGKHGFFLHYIDSNNVQEILGKGVPLLEKIDTIDRAACRNQFEENFTSHLMAMRYEWFFNHTAENGPVQSVEVPF